MRGADRENEGEEEGKQLEKGTERRWRWKRRRRKVNDMKEEREERRGTIKIEERQKKG